MTSEFTIGLHVLGFLTARGGEPLTSEVLARTYGTSPVVLRRVLSKLRQAGLVATRRGVGGGSVLGRPSSEISLLDVYVALTDEPELLPRHPGENTGPAQVLAAYINGIYAEAEAALLERLATVSIEQMDSEVRPEICAALEASRLVSVARA
ncbi:MAG: Rrf2 family transcriptional regulator [Gemmatimonadota bacterium]